MSDIVTCVGEQITPRIDLAGAVKIAEFLYGVKVQSARELDGYDDKNYHLKVSNSPSNSFITELWPHGYVLKITNSLDSKNHDLLEAQCQLMMHLDKHGIRTPQPQQSTNGRLYCLEKLESEGTNISETNIHNEHAIRLLSYEEGTLMKAIPWSYELHYKVGKYVAKLNLLLKGFERSVYKEYSSIWLLKNVPYVKQYLFVIEDQNRISLVTEVIKEFKQSVLPILDSLNSGTIHGDINEQNLVCLQNNEGQWEISAVLDLGDSHHSAYMIELALTMTYMMMQSGRLESGRHVIAGYCSLHPLPQDELKLLKICVCARLCQSLVLGLYSHSKNPQNTYVLGTQAQGWTLLETLWSTEADKLEDTWLNNF